MLITSRLLFRHFVLADLDQLHCEIYHNSEVARMLSPTGIISRQQTAQLLYRRLKHWQTYGFGAWALIDKANHDLVGHCGLHYLSNSNLSNSNPNNCTLNNLNLSNPNWSNPIVAFPQQENAAEIAGIELTYTIKPAYWGQGLATEAARAVLKWGFETLSLRQIVAVTSPTNRASQRVLEKLGMVYTKSIDYNYTEGLYYTISVEQWQQQEIQ